MDPDGTLGNVVTFDMLHNHILYFLTFPFSVAPFCIDFPFQFFCDSQNNALNLSPHFFSAQRKKSFGKIGNLKAHQCEKIYKAKQDLTRYAKKVEFAYRNAVCNMKIHSILRVLPLLFFVICTQQRMSLTVSHPYFCVYCVYFFPSY